MNKYSHLDQSTKLAIDSFLKTAMKMAKRFGKTNPSENTRNEYIKLAKQLLFKRTKSKQSLREIISFTRSKRTYYKRITALRYYILQIGSDSAETLMKRQCEIAEHNLKKAAADVAELLALVEGGANKVFSKTVSKRSSLKGLPGDWTEKICGYNQHSKYREALNVIALTGCRPSELKKGVSVTYQTNINGGSELTFKIIGSKVSDQSGQEWRTITYHDIEKGECFSNFIESMKLARNKIISIDSPINFTVEIRRIAKEIWPDHKKPITACCFRHQFSANLKSMKIGDDASKALGHRSTKTRRLYGVASQARGKPMEITISASHDLKQHLENGNDGVEP